MILKAMRHNDYNEAETITVSKMPSHAGRRDPVLTYPSPFFDVVDKQTIGLGLFMRSEGLDLDGCVGYLDVCDHLLHRLQLAGGAAELGLDLAQLGLDIGEERITFTLLSHHTCGSSTTRALAYRHDRCECRARGVHSEQEDDLHAPP